MIQIVWTATDITTGNIAVFNVYHDKTDLMGTLIVLVDGKYGREH